MRKIYILLISFCIECVFVSYARVSKMQKVQIRTLEEDDSVCLVLYDLNESVFDRNVERLKDGLCCLDKLNKKELVDVSFDRSGLNLLHRAVATDCISTVRELVVYGANVNIYNYCGDCPLSIAEESCECDMVKYLKSHGASKFYAT